MPSRLHARLYCFVCWGGFCCGANANIAFLCVCMWLFLYVFRMFVYLCLNRVCVYVWGGFLYICEGFSFALLIRYGRIRVALSYYFNNYLLISCMCGYPFCFVLYPFRLRLLMFVCFAGWFYCFAVFCKLLPYYRHLSILLMCCFRFCLFLFSSEESCLGVCPASVVKIRLFVTAQASRCGFGCCSLF